MDLSVAGREVKKKGAAFGVMLALSLPCVCEAAERSRQSRDAKGIPASMRGNDMM